MIPRQAPLDGPALLVADRGAGAHEVPDSPAAYRLAARLGAHGVATDLRATADGVPVLRRDARLGGLRRRRIEETDAAGLPDEVVDASTWFGELADGAHLIVRVAAPEAVGATVELAERHGVVDRVWLVSADRDQLVSWRSLAPGLRLLDATPIGAMSTGPERHAADLREARVDGVLLPHADWTGGRTALFHRFGRRCFADGAPHERHIRTLLHIGIDGVISTHPDRLADAATAHGAPDAPQMLDE